MFSTFCEIGRSNIDDGAPNGFRGSDNNVIVFCDLKRIEGSAGEGLVEDTRVNRIWNRIVDEFAKYETIFAFVEKLHCGGWDGETRTNV
jgi:hypothetical protein